MRLVEFSTSDGKLVFVNRDAIESLSQHTDTEVLVRYIGGHTGIVISGTLHEAVETIRNAP